MFTSVRAFVVHRNAHNAPVIGQHIRLTTQAQAGKCHAWVTEAVLEKSARNQRQSTKAVGRASSKRFISSFPFCGANSKPLTRRATPSTSAPQTITWLLVCTMGLL